MAWKPRGIGNVGVNGLGYRFSWIIGTVFSEIRATTVPIISRKTVKTAPIRPVIGTVYPTFLKTVPQLSTLRQ